jgi:hypothetical protein
VLLTKNSKKLKKLFYKVKINEEEIKKRSNRREKEEKGIQQRSL